MNPWLSGVLGVHGRVVLLLMSLLLEVAGGPPQELPAAASTTDDATHNLRMHSSRMETVPIPAPKSEAATHGQVSVAYGHLPLHFETNQGQTNPRVKFLARGSSLSLFLTTTEAVLVLRHPAPSLAGDETAVATPLGSGPRTPDVGHLLRMWLVGANSQPQVMGLEELPSKSHSPNDAPPGPSPVRMRGFSTVHMSAHAAPPQPMIDCDRRLQPSLKVSFTPQTLQVRISYRTVHAADTRWWRTRDSTVCYSPDGPAVQGFGGSSGSPGISG
jgi:hypothetical protein